MRPITALILILLVYGIAESQETGEKLRDIETRVERILLENILPFSMRKMGDIDSITISRGSGSERLPRVW